VCSFVAPRKGYWRNSQASPGDRTMPGKRVLPFVAQDFRGDCAEGLGRYWTGFLYAGRAEKERGQVQAV
jgi:hypothetical protein